MTLPETGEGGGAPATEGAAAADQTSGGGAEAGGGGDAGAGQKLFIGGVSWDTTDEEFNNYFAAFGKMSDCVLMRDRNTGRSRGFGFVTYVAEQDTKAVLSTVLELSGRKLDAKVAVPRGQADGAPGTNEDDSKKIFVGAIAQGTTQEEFTEYFKTYGEITDSVIMIDKHTGRSRGFGFVTFAEASAVSAVLEHNEHEINGKKLDCKKATPREANRPPARNSGGYGRGGGGGGGYDYNSYGGGGGYGRGGWGGGWNYGGGGGYGGYGGGGGWQGGYGPQGGGYQQGPPQGGGYGAYGPGGGGGAPHPYYKGPQGGGHSGYGGGGGRGGQNSYRPY